MWRIEYSKEIRNYIFDSYPYTEAVWQAIKSLSRNPSGLPEGSYTRLHGNYYLWEIHDHIVIYEILPERQCLSFVVLKPKE